MRDWYRYIRGWIQTDLWGFVLLDYYYEWKRTEGHAPEGPTSFLHNALRELNPVDVDAVHFHRVLLSVCVELLGNDFDDIFLVVSEFFGTAKAQMSDEVKKQIAGEYVCYGKSDAILELLGATPTISVSGESRSEILQIVQQEVSPDSALTVRDIRGKVDVGIMTVRNDEFDAVLSRFKTRQTIIGGKNFYEYAVLGGKEGAEHVAICRCIQQGQAKAQTVAGDMIDELDPTWLFIVGIAGGFPDAEYTLGDVLLASKVHDFSVSARLSGTPDEYDSSGYQVHTDVEKLLAHLISQRTRLGDWESVTAVSCPMPSEIIQTRMTKVELKKHFYGNKSWIGRTHTSLLRFFGEGTEQRRPIIWVGPSVSGNVLLKSTTLAAAWKKYARAAVSVEMELPGVFEAARGRGSGNCRVVAIRGVSDIIGYKRKPEWTQYACNTAASFAVALITSGLLKLVRK